MIMEFDMPSAHDCPAAELSGLGRGAERGGAAAGRRQTEDLDLCSFSAHAVRRTTGARYRGRDGSQSGCSGIVKSA
jgi:hypothetical protein